MRRLARVALALILTTTQFARAGVRTEVTRVLPPPPAAQLETALTDLDSTIEAIKKSGSLGMQTSLELQVAYVMTLLTQYYSADRTNAVRALGQTLAAEVPETAAAVARNFGSSESYQRLIRRARAQDPVAVPTELLDYPKGAWQLGVGAAGTAVVPLSIVLVVAGLIGSVVAALAGESVAMESLVIAADAAQNVSVAENQKVGLTERSFGYAKSGVMRVSNRRSMVDVVKTVRPKAWATKLFCETILTSVK